MKLFDHLPSKQLENHQSVGYVMDDIQQRVRVRSPTNFEGLMVLPRNPSDEQPTFSSHLFLEESIDLVR